MRLLKTLTTVTTTIPETTSAKSATPGAATKSSAAMAMVISALPIIPSNGLSTVAPNRMHSWLTLRISSALLRLR